MAIMLNLLNTINLRAYILYTISQISLHDLFGNFAVRFILNMVEMNTSHHDPKKKERKVELPLNSIAELLLKLYVQPCPVGGTTFV